MISLIAGWTADMWAPVINLFNFIPSYAWMLIVFTIILKLILSPLDFWQRKVSRDSTLKQAKLQPEIEKINKKYANNKELLNKRTMELYKRENYNVMGSCLSMIVNMAITLFIFITLFTGLTEISRDTIYKQYNELKTTYNTTYQNKFAQEYGLTITEDMDQNEINIILKTKLDELINNQKVTAKEQLINEHKDDTKYVPKENEIFERAKKLAYEEESLANIISLAQSDTTKKYDSIKDGWLWVNNIWRPDTNVSAYPDFDTFLSTSSFTSQQFYKDAIKDKTQEEKDNLMKEWREEYNLVTAGVLKENSGWNGYFILVLLAGLVTWLSTYIPQKMMMKKGQNQPQPQGGMKIMQIIMPIIMMIFTITYSATFALYIVTNSLMSLLLSIFSMLILNKTDKKKKEISTKKKLVEYSR